MPDRDTIRRRALVLVAENGHEVAKRLGQEFGLSRQQANAHLQALLGQGLIVATGSTRARVYRLATLRQDQRTYPRQGLQEDLVWREVFAPAVADLPENVRDIWRYGVTEMVNNAIDHSGSEQVTVGVTCNALYCEAVVTDQGEGVFLKIQRSLGLYDPREALLELAKGKLTTDPANHTGEGIFFTSKVLDKFAIVSGNLSFMHGYADSDWLMDHPDRLAGTGVYLRLANDSPRTLKQVFDEFAAPESFDFSKTIVPVRLAQYEGEKLVSRSQAKRLYQRFEKFRQVVLDFEGVAEIGQAFADELLRVFPAAHPNVLLTPINMTEAVARMASRVQTGTGSS